MRRIGDAACDHQLDAVGASLDLLARLASEIIGTIGLDIPRRLAAMPARGCYAAAGANQTRTVRPTGFDGLAQADVIVAVFTTGADEGDAGFERILRALLDNPRQDFFPA